jgi:hypothetical protein
MVVPNSRNGYADQLSHHIDARYQGKETEHAAKLEQLRPR